MNVIGRLTDELGEAAGESGVALGARGRLIACLAMAVVCELLVVGMTRRSSGNTWCVGGGERGGFAMRWIGSLARRSGSPAVVISVIALAVALGGSGYAAFKVPRGSVGHAQLRPGAVQSDVVKDGSLLTRDFNPHDLPKGPRATRAPRMSSSGRARGWRPRRDRLGRRSPPARATSVLPAAAGASPAIPTPTTALSSAGPPRVRIPTARRFAGRSRSSMATPRVRAHRRRMWCARRRKRPRWLIRLASPRGGGPCPRTSIRSGWRS
jgi:hypothetical protein